MMCIFCPTEYIFQASKSGVISYTFFSKFTLKIHLFHYLFIFMSVLLHVCMFMMNVPSQSECQKRVQKSPEMELQIVICYMGPGKPTLVLPKSSKCSQTEPLFSLPTNHSEIHVLIIYSNTYELIT